jgi:hypothetical protein
MRPGRFCTTAVAATAVVGVSAPAALASVTPNPARPGQIVTVSDDGRCGPDQGATASSSLFGEVPLHRDGRHLTGRVQIPERTAPGTYKVVIRCVLDDRRFTDLLKVERRPRGGSQSGQGGGADASRTGEIVGGAALITLAGAGAYVLMRRRTSRQN